MALPPLAPIPPANIRLTLGPAEWEACLDAWLTLTGFYLRSPPELLSSSVSKDSSLSNFLISFYQEAAGIQRNDGTLVGPKARALTKTAFLLTNRLVTELEFPSSLLEWTFLSNFCHVHMKNAAVSGLMSSFWQRQTNHLTTILQRQKDVLTKALESSLPSSANKDLERLALVTRASSDAGAFFMTGSDFVDALISAYSRMSDLEQRKAVVSNTYLGLLSLVNTPVPNFSILSDHLYSLKSDADQKKEQPSLLADLITNTPLVSKIRRTVTGKSPDRLSKLLDQIETYRAQSVARPRKHVRRKVNKGKGRAPEQSGELHMHRMSLVTQIQDLFPDLGAGFIMRLLDEYDDDVEQVTAHLLDDSLPPHLQPLDRTEQAPTFDATTQEAIDQLIPRSTPPPIEPFIPHRHNVYDDDELDNMQLGTARLHIGKRPDTNPSQAGPTNKAAILSALAAFDSDDDERDDTYDLEDVGGTVDSAHPDGEPAPSAQTTQAETDAALFGVFKSSPELFARTFDVRKGQARAALKRETGLTDEAIEGWAIMVQRDPRRLRRLEAQHGAFDGRQASLAPTAYRESPGGTETEDSDAPGGSRGAFRGRGGRGGRGGGGGGRGGRGRGGNVAGPAGEAATVSAQRNKEANKGSRANHNRRDQRAKKMARGGFPG